MMEDIFENLSQALAEFGEEVIRLYRQRLASDDKNSSGALSESLRPLVVNKGTEIKLYLTAQDYIKYVEDGLQPEGRYGNPGWKAYPHILDWIHTKPSLQGEYRLPEDKSDMTLPTDKQLAYLVTRKIVESGIKPGRQLQETVDALAAKYEPILKAAIERDFDAYALKVYTDIGKKLRSL